MTDQDPGPPYADAHLAEIYQQAKDDYTKVVCPVCRGTMSVRDALVLVEEEGAQTIRERKNWLPNSDDTVLRVVLGCDTCVVALSADVQTPPGGWTTQV